jgi:hypothetical protein
MTGRARLPAAPHRRLAARWRALVAIWPALLPPLAFIPVILAPPLTADGGAVLDFARRWLAGGRLYVDLIDVNPPLIFLLNLVPAAIARATGLDAVLALQACLLALAFWQWRLALLVRDRAREPPVERLLLDVLPGLMAFGAGYLFGERETLMVSAALPYLLAAARREAGAVPRARRVTAVVAAIGFALKPHFLVIPLMVELAVLAGRRRRLGSGMAWRASLRDPVPWLMAALWLLYAAALELAFPAYLGRIVPLARQYYDAVPGLTAAGLLLRPGMAMGAALLAAGSWIAWRRPWRGEDALPRLLALGGIGALASALSQHAGWGQHVLAVQLFAFALAAVLAARRLDRAGVARRPGGTVRAAGMLSALFAALCVQFGRAPLVELHYPASDDARLERAIRATSGGTAMALSSGVALFPAASYAGAVTVQRYMDLWLLQGLYQSCPVGGRRYRSPAEMGDAERRVYHGMAEDFARARPALVLVDGLTGIPDCGGRFDYLAYFLRNPLFAEAWREYRLAEAWGRFQIYVRQ